MVLGAALSERAAASGSERERQQAIECLVDSLEASISSEEHGTAPDEWHGFALARLLPLTFCKTASDLDLMPADRLLSTAGQALRQPRLDQEEAAFWHTLSGQAYFARTIRDGQLGEIEQALASVRTALELLPKRHFLRAPLAMYVSAILHYRFLTGGSLVDGDAATAHLPPSIELAGLADDGPDVGPDLGLLDAYRLLGSGNPLLGGQRDSAEPAIARLRQALAALPDDNRDRCGLMGLLGVVLLTCAEHSGASPATEEGLALLIQAADQAGQDSPYYAHLNDWAALWLARVGTANKDIQLIDGAISRVSGPIPRPGLVPGEGLRRARTLGSLLGDRYMLSGRSRDIDRSIEILARCQRDMGREPSWRAALLLLELAQNYRIRGLRLAGDNRRAIKTGMAGLLAAAGDVLLQTDTRRGLQAAGGVRSWAGLVALWCLIDNHPHRAVQALELGRSLVLQSATVAADVPGLLRSAGHDDLAARWQREAGRVRPRFDLAPLGEADATYLSDLLELPADADADAPSDIWRQVLAALSKVSADTALLAPPAIEELAEGLRGTSFDALVYLLPPDPTWTRNGQYRPGCALIVRPDGQVREIPLPRLTVEPVATYAEAYQAWTADMDNPSLHREWDRALNVVCGWAWEALAGPVLSHAAGWRLPRPPRLVLIPTGNLGIIPWHAARMTCADGSSHYAVEDAVWSYAASARQLMNASRRAHRPWADSPVLLADTNGDLPMAALEAFELRRVFYPGAVLIGQAGDSSPDASMGEEVLARLPGGSAEQASMLHCCCHASVCGDLSASYLQLAGGQRLTVAHIMAQAQGREPGTPGYLTVLSACTSDFADVHHDEALTLASALLAAGASGVVGTRWPVGGLGRRRGDGGISPLPLRGGREPGRCAARSPAVDARSGPRCTGGPSAGTGPSGGVRTPVPDPQLGRLHLPGRVGDETAGRQCH